MSVFSHHGFYMMLFVFFIGTVISDVPRHLLIDDADEKTTILAEHLQWIRQRVHRLMVDDDNNEKMSGMSKLTEFRVVFKEFATFLGRRYIEENEEEGRFHIFMVSIIFN